MAGRHIGGYAGRGSTTWRLPQHRLATACAACGGGCEPNYEDPVEAQVVDEGREHVFHLVHVAVARRRRAHDAADGAQGRLGRLAVEGAVQRLVEVRVLAAAPPREREAPPRPHRSSRCADP